MSEQHDASSSWSSLRARTRLLLLEAARVDYDGQFARLVCAALAEIDVGTLMSQSDVDLLRRMAQEDRSMAERPDVPPDPSVEVPLVSLLAVIDVRRVTRSEADLVARGIDLGTLRELQRVVGTPHEHGTGDLAGAIVAGLIALAGRRDVAETHREVLGAIASSQMSNPEVRVAVRALLSAVDAGAMDVLVPDEVGAEISREKCALDQMVDAAREGRLHPSYAQATVGEVNLEYVEDKILPLHPDREVTLSAGTLRAIVARVFDLVDLGRTACERWSAHVSGAGSVAFPTEVEERDAIENARSRMFPSAIVSGPGVSDFLAPSGVEDRARVRVASDAPKRFDARAVELACRLVAPGPKAAQVSASECHEVSDYLLAAYTNEGESDFGASVAGDERDVVAGRPPDEALDPDMKEEYDFSDGVRGLFYRPGMSRRLGRGLTISTMQLRSLSEFAAVRAGSDPDARKLAHAISTAIQAYVNRRALTPEARLVLETMPSRLRWREGASSLAVDVGTLIRAIDVESSSMADGIAVLLSADDVKTMRGWRADMLAIDCTPTIVGIVDRALREADRPSLPNLVIPIVPVAPVAGCRRLVAVPLCAQCGERPAVCIGSYEGGEGKADEPACDECCGHGNEDGRCRPLAPADWKIINHELI